MENLTERTSQAGLERLTLKHKPEKSLNEFE